MKKKQNILFLNKFILFILLFLSLPAYSQFQNPFLTKRTTGTNPYSSDKKTIHIVFDASGSMEDKINGETKIRIAKKVLEEVILKADRDLNIGLRVYGSSNLTRDPEVNCSDSKLLISPGIDNRRSIVSEVDKVLPQGLTPITFSLVEAIHDLAPYQGEKSIILISDGIETCGGDPCLLARKLETEGIDLKIDVVGYGLRDDRDAQAQLKCVALATMGRYFAADTAAELSNGLAESFSKKVTGRILLMTEPQKNNYTDNLPLLEPEKINIKQ